MPEQSTSESSAAVAVDGGADRFALQAGHVQGVDEQLYRIDSITLNQVEGTLPMDWRDRAACLDEDPELFFPIGNTGPAILQIEEAKAVCRRCDVIDTCLKWALESGQDAGVWGGLSEDERRALKRRTRPGGRGRARSPSGRAACRPRRRR